MTVFGPTLRTAMLGGPGPDPPRRRLSRTFSRSRFHEYRQLLERALAQGYTIRSLEEWVQEPDRTKPPILILRHDVDQHPRAVRPMLAHERELDLRATWYFRWRTAHPTIVAAVREAGGAVGLHYETLTRLVLSSGRAPQIDDALLAQARALLRLEIRTFVERFGPIQSVCPHGDTRAPGVRNGVLLEDQDPEAYGVRFDGNLAVNRPLGCWLTDRTAAEGRWKNHLDPLPLLQERVSPILCLTHPNNWASGPGLWVDRIISAALPARLARWPIRTGVDQPPLATPTEPRGGPPGRPGSSG